MKFRTLFIFMMVFSVGCISCRNTFNNRQDSNPQESITPSSKRQKTRKSVPKTDTKKPIETSTEKEIKKKRIKARDTLKPLVAIP